VVSHAAESGKLLQSHNTKKTSPADNVRTQKSSTKNRHELTLAAQGLAMAAEMDEWLAQASMYSK